MDNSIWLPFLVIFPMVSAAIGYIIGRKNKNARNKWACAVTFIEFLAALYMCLKDVSYIIPDTFAMGIEFRAGGIRGVFTVIAAFVWLMSTLFSTEYFRSYRNRNRYYFFMLFTLGATMGVFLSADFYTTLIFFEIMSFTSWVLVMHDETENAMRAGMTYLTVAVIGGLVTLLGMFFMYKSAGTLNFEQLGAVISAASDKKEYYIYGVLILVGFAAKAGAFPLHIWLPEAHPVAPAPASALLSCVLTKTGIFGVLALSAQIFTYDADWGLFILIVGTITMFLGAFLAVFSINLKRTLACSSLSQIGFILVGIGMQGLLGEHNALAAGGTILHAANHSIIKMTLFLCAGAVYMNLHELDLNKIRGWGKDKKLLKLVFLQGLLGIGGIPLWGGYISKTLLHESIVEYIEHLAEHGHSTMMFNIIEWVFLISGGLTLAYMTKLFIAVFVEKNPYGEMKGHSHDGKDISGVSSAVLVCCAVIISLFGIFPHRIMEPIADMARSFMHSHAPEHAVHYFALVNLKGAVISVAIGSFVYVFVIRGLLMRKDENGNRIYTDSWPKFINIEKKIYRPLLLKVMPAVGGFGAGILNASFEKISSAAICAAGGFCQFALNPSFEAVYKISEKAAVNAVKLFDPAFEVIYKSAEAVSVKAVNIFDPIFEAVYKLLENISGDIMQFIMEPSFEKLFNIVYGFAAKAMEIFSALFENLFLIMLILGLSIMRFFKSMWDYAIQVVLYFLFNYDEISYEGKRQFRKDAYFSKFSLDRHGEEQGARENLSISLMLFGVGVVAALIYLII